MVGSLFCPVTNTPRRCASFPVPFAPCTIVATSASSSRFLYRHRKACDPFSLALSQFSCIRPFLFLTTAFIILLYSLHITLCIPLPASSSVPSALCFICAATHSASFIIKKQNSCMNMANPPPSPRSSASTQRPALRTRASSSALSSASRTPQQSTTPSANHHHSSSVSSRQPPIPNPKTAAWMQKLRKWKSRDDGLWGCAGDARIGLGCDDDIDPYVFGSTDVGQADELASLASERKTLPPLPERIGAAQYALAYNGSYSDITSSGGGSGTSSQRSSMRSSTHSTRSRLSGQASPSIASASSLTRNDLLAREQEGAIEALTSYMARTHPMAHDGSPASPASMSSFSSSSPSSTKFPSVPLGPYGTIRPSDRQASLSYAKTRPRADTSAAFSPPSPPSSMVPRRSPSMQQLRGAPHSTRNPVVPAPPPSARSSSPMTRPSTASAAVARSRVSSGATHDAAHGATPRPSAGGATMTGSRRTSGAAVASSNVVVYEPRGVDKSLYSQAQSTQRSYSFI